MVQRGDILELEAYESLRHELRPELMRAKRERQVIVGDCLNFMFENVETVRYQIQEILRVESIEEEHRVRLEIETYNRLLGASGELGCTLLVEFSRRSCSDGNAGLLSGLRDSLYVELPGRRRVRAVPSGREASEACSLVQFLTFRVGGVVPVAVGSTHPELRAEARLPEATQRALGRDLCWRGGNRWRVGSTVQSD